MCTCGRGEGGGIIISLSQTAINDSLPYCLHFFLINQNKCSSNNTKARTGDASKFDVLYTYLDTYIINNIHNNILCEGP